MTPPFSSTRTKVQLKLVVQRLKMLQEKKTSMSKKDRRDVASLVERGKVETARIKTEGVIAEDIHVELLEVLELYCEMLIARLALLDLPGREPDAGLLEPLCALIHAAPRTELKELHVLREMLMARYTREFAIRATEDQEECVPRRITDRLRVQTPDEAYVDANTKSDAAVATALGTSGAMTSGAQPPGGLVDKPDLDGKALDPVDELEKRFAALKRKT
ncbi:Spindle pole body protein [Ceraceosorus bombacis]|uniref:Spindle pole body protein n=1 Tax=Ceraceosorus bombacis TaxID=401625 RepID=A0A0N7LBD3_9BASI|nr:Spindle pole body protein [Ceraceosorus bombacis]